MPYGKEAFFDTAYQYLGVHREGTSYIFRVYAPRADSVYLVGDFNGWSESCPMMRLCDGIWERSVSTADIEEGTLYKYKIKNGCFEEYKADPYSFCSKDASETASVVCDIFSYKWRDSSWLEYRCDQTEKKPINIYKIHATSWKRHDNGKAYSWRELATEIAPYVKQMGYTHIELMPIMEQADEVAFGYSVGAFYAPSARMGTPFDFMGFVDSMHEAGIGVILDLIPSRFAKNTHCLTEFDGQPLYEYETEREERINGNSFFDIGRYEVKSYIISNALFWIDVYHADGLCFDSDSVDLFSKTEEGTEFFKTLKESVLKRFADVVLVDPCEIKLSEEFNGDDPHRSAFIKADIGYQIMFADKKALFMGTEIGQTFRKASSLAVDWHLLAQKTNANLQYYVAELNHLCLKESPLWYDHIEIIETNDIDIKACKRVDDKGNELLIALNLNSDIPKKIRIGVLKDGGYKQIFCSDESRSLGDSVLSFNAVELENIKHQNSSRSICLNIPPMSLAVFKYVDQQQ